MRMKTRKRRPDVIFRSGKPAAVIVDIDEYQKMLEQLEDAEDLAELAEMRKKPLRFRKLADFLLEHGPGV